MKETGANCGGGEEEGEGKDDDDDDDDKDGDKDNKINKDAMLPCRPGGPVGRVRSLGSSVHPCVILPPPPGGGHCHHRGEEELGFPLRAP